MEKPGQGSGEEVKNARVQEGSDQANNTGGGFGAVDPRNSEDYSQPDPLLRSITDAEISKSVHGVYISSRRVAHKRNLGSLAGELLIERSDVELKTTQELDLPSSVQPKVKSRKKRELLDLPSSVQMSPKQLLPTPETGSWWECPANDEGWQIKLRWRGGEAPFTYVFARVGKFEFQTWKELNEDERRRTIADRLGSELHTKGRNDVAKRIGLTIGDD